MNRILVKIYFPIIEENFDVWIPLDKKIYQIINLLAKNILKINLTDKTENMPFLYNKYTGFCYDLDIEIKDTDIKNSTELIFI